MIEMLPPTLPTTTMTRMIAFDMISLIFASIHTTTDNSLAVLYAIADHEECVDELLEEQEAVLAEEENEEAEEENEETEESVKLNGRAIKKMVKLDSFLREVLRNNDRWATLPHKNTRREDVVLPDGLVVSKGAILLFKNDYLAYLCINSQLLLSILTNIRRACYVEYVWCL